MVGAVCLGGDTNINLAFFPESLRWNGRFIGLENNGLKFEVETTVIFGVVVFGIIEKVVGRILG